MIASVTSKSGTEKQIVNHIMLDCFKKQFPIIRIFQNLLKQYHSLTHPRPTFINLCDDAKKFQRLKNSLEVADLWHESY